MSDPMQNRNSVSPWSGAHSHPLLIIWKQYFKNSVCIESFHATGRRGKIFFYTPSSANFSSSLLESTHTTTGCKKTSSKIFYTKIGYQNLHLTLHVSFLFNNNHSWVSHTHTSFHIGVFQWFLKFYEFQYWS